MVYWHKFNTNCKLNWLKLNNNCYALSYLNIHGNKILMNINFSLKV